MKVLVLSLAALALVAGEPARVVPFQKGVCYAYTLGRGRGYESPKSHETLEHVKAIGADWVSLTPFAWYRRLDDPSIEMIGDRGRGAETDDAMRKGAADAHSLGLRVLLKPHLWGHSGWVGDLAMKSEPDWETFHANYRRFALHYAALAEETRCEAFCMGVELRGSTLTHPAFWRSLAAEIRGAYHGLLVYGANWDAEFDRIEFWDALDEIGVQAFFPIASGPGAAADDLRRGAQRAAERVGALSTKLGKPAVLTEVGFRSVPDAGLRPWVEPETTNEPDDGGASQASCYRAVLEAFWGRPWFRGLYSWKWESGGVSDPSDFHVAGKPAEKVLAEWFAKPPSR
jgi:glycosyl hydrolase family 113